MEYPAVTNGSLNDFLDNLIREYISERAAFIIIGNKSVLF